MYTYETGLLDKGQMQAFVERFESEIGTECEITTCDAGKYVVVCHELETRSEVKACRQIEQGLPAMQIREA